MKGFGKVMLYILSAVIVLLALVHLGVTVGYHRFFMNAESRFLVPGMDSPFVQQGLDYVQEKQVYLISGYMDDGSASRIYIREDGGDVRFVELKDANGMDYTRHCGGICHNGRYVYVTDNNGLVVFTLDDILDGGNATILGQIDTGFEAAFCTFYDGYLLAGEFYRAGSHETDSSHCQIAPDGEQNHALISVFQGSEGAAFGIMPTPVAAISIPEQVQGICFTAEDEIVLSTSYGLASSHLSYHSINTGNVGRISLSGTEVPLLYLDSTSLTEQVTLPPMSEGILYQDGKVVVMFESASNKYFFGKFIRGYQVFAYELEEQN